MSDLTRMRHHLPLSPVVGAELLGLRPAVATD